MSWLYSINQNESTAFWLAVFGFGYVAYKIWDTYLTRSSTINTLRGPESASWLYGNNQDTYLPYRNQKFERWMQEYGTVFPIHGSFGGRDLLIVDTTAMSFIFNRPLDFPKSRNIQNLVKNLFGAGLLVVEGFEHKRQRKVLNPVFSAMAMKDISPMLMRVAHELRDEWKKVLLGSTSASGFTEIDVLSWFGRATLDMIGLAGFGYKFNSLQDSTNELATAFNELSQSMSVIKIMGMLTTYVPLLRHLPIGSNTVNIRNFAIMRRTGSQMVTEKKVEAEKIGGEGAELGKDLLSVIVRANMQENPADRLDDDTLLAEISTFLIAGHETTSNAISWGLYALAKNPAVQAKLRDEVLAFPDDSPSMEDLNTMPYLGNVVKEILRLTSPVTNTRRLARSDTVIPLSQPIVDKHGKQVNEIFVRRGDTVMVHNHASNTRANIWGPDALEFRPERFDALPKAVSDIPSIFSGLTTFISGPRQCIGWRMAVLEMKVFLFTLIRTFELGIDPKLEITSGFALAVKPQVHGREDEGFQLPLRVSLHQA
ncbi:hypothetical protein FRB94_008261 [Tulasnella sp. JGI-2019a]|nr:hypothetical protein FRB94_008261 [Tulasnella sp. JGI-2019a]KAG9010607.1 hypothetical protein FRB93_003875 [Tulasnella sp. JGI-2019a]KAG9030881.1 hypothetical protein FRB95_003444 [Tulasnella sp. JGI-2019a]